MKGSPFDHRQDRELGAALRTALSGSDEAVFVRRVLDRAATLQGRMYSGGEWWEILSAWARPGLAAAAVGVAAAVTFWVSTGRDGASTDVILSDPLQASVEIPEEFLDTQPPGLNEVLSMEFGNR